MTNVEKGGVMTNHRDACALPADDVAGGGDWDLLDDFDAEAFEAGYFARVIGEQADALEVEVGEDLRADADFALGAALVFGQRGQALFVVKLQGQLVAELLDGVACEVWCR